MNQRPQEPNVEAAHMLLERTRWFWRFCLVLPFLYLGVAFAVENIWFAPDNEYGFWPMRQETFDRVLIAMGAIALAAQGAILFIRRRYERKLADARLIPVKLAFLYRKRTFLLATFSDIPSGLGLIAFLINGDWTPLVVLCAFSYFLYAQAYPRGRLLKEEGGHGRG